MNRANKIIKIASITSAITFLIAGILTYMGKSYWSNFMIGNLWIMAPLSCMIEYVRSKEVDNSVDRS